MALRIPDILVRHVFEPAWDRYEGSVRLATMRRLAALQWSEPERVRERQNRKLRKIVRHAASTSPFYAERFASAGIDPEQVQEIGDLSGLPVLRKSDIRAETHRILSSAYKQSELVKAKTGGSTGVALEIFCDRRGVEKRNGAALWTDEWSGWRLGQPRAAVWGNPPQADSLRSRLRRALKDRLIYLDTMKIDEAAVDRFLRQWRAMRPGMLFGHAHSLYILAENLAARGVELRPDGIVATSMMLLQKEREVIEEVCGVPVTNRYGCEEVSLIACECEQHRGMHLNAEHNIVEFLRDDGSPCAPGEDGRIVVSELINFGMPMLRYEVGDRGVPSDRICECGRGLPLMESITGRTADFLVAEDGSKVAGISLIENTLTRLPGIHQMQLIQDRPSALRVNLVRGEAYNDDVGDALCAILRGALGSGFTMDLEFVEAIPQEESGKYRFSICKL